MKKKPRHILKEATDDIGTSGITLLNAKIGPGQRTVTDRRRKHTSLPSLCREPRADNVEVQRLGMPMVEEGVGWVPQLLQDPKPGL